MFLNINQHPTDAEAAVDDSGRRMTYGKLCDICEEISHVISSRELVFILCRNCLGAFSGYMGFVSAKAVPLLLNEAMEEGMLRSMIDLYHPSYLWVPERRAGEFEGETVYSCYDYALIRTGRKAPALHENLSLLLTTSGSTGSPKLVRHSYRNLEASARNIASFFGFTSSERAMADLPMQYTMGLSVLHSHMIVGATVLLTEYSLLSSDFWEYLKNERATNFTGVPFSYECFKRLRFTRMDLPDLTTLAQGGGKLTDEMFRELAEYADRTGKRFFATFGQTECTARMAYCPPDRALEKTGTIGIAIPEGELFLLDDDGREIKETVAEGEMGYRGPNVTMGYATTPEELLLGDEWHGETHTGDMARRDEDGFYYIIGRKTRFLKLYGYRVSLDQTERMLETAFGVECACTGTDKRMEIYVTSEEHADEIPSYLAKATGILKGAFHVSVIDSIPRNESGKIRYKDLK